MKVYVAICRLEMFENAQKLLIDGKFISSLFIVVTEAFANVHFAFHLGRNG